MNTKIFIISIALILMFPESSSVGASFQKQILPVQNQVHIVTPPDNKQPSDKAMDWTFNWSLNDVVHHGQQSDDDNKSHHFHYERFFKNRKRILFSFFLKILLVITHISSLLYASMHLLH